MNYSNIYNSIIEKRKLEIPPGYTETHHILPRCLGGTNDKNNLVKLTAKEHFICHLLLTKMYPKGSIEYYKICHSFLMMLVISKNQIRYITSKRYELLKESFSVRMSVLQSGKQNNQYGTKWIHNKELKQCKKVPKDAILEAGWENGRKLKWDCYKNINCKICDIEIFSGTICDLCKRENRIKNNKINKSASKKCYINGIIFESVADAAKELSIKQNTLQWRIKNMENYYYI